MVAVSTMPCSVLAEPRSAVKLASGSIMASAIRQIRFAAAASALPAIPTLMSGKMNVSQTVCHIAAATKTSVPCHPMEMRHVIRAYAEYPVIPDTRAMAPIVSQPVCIARPTTPLAA